LQTTAVNNIFSPLYFHVKAGEMTISQAHKRVITKIQKPAEVLILIENSLLLSKEFIFCVMTQYLEAHFMMFFRNLPS
jgi:hypothetical protein